MSSKGRPPRSIMRRMACLPTFEIRPNEILGVVAECFQRTKDLEKILRAHSFDAPGLVRDLCDLAQGASDGSHLRDGGGERRELAIGKRGKPPEMRAQKV